MNIVTSYMIDADRKIVSVGGAWEQFSAENGGRNLSSADIRNKSIFDYVAGDSSRLWLDSLIPMAIESNELLRSNRFRVGCLPLGWGSFR